MPAGGGNAPRLVVLSYKEQDHAIVAVVKSSIRVGARFQKEALLGGRYIIQLDGSPLEPVAKGGSAAA